MVHPPALLSLDCIPYRYRPLDPIQVQRHAAPIDPRRRRWYYARDHLQKWYRIWRTPVRPAYTHSVVQLLHTSPLVHMDNL